MTEQPFYKRDLASFADEIITRQTERDGRWHAVLDCGFNDYVSDPDFAPHGYGKTRQEAAERCASAIRLDAQGIGKFAPHSVLVPGYDLHFRLMKHWSEKERFQRVGVDPNEMVLLARGLDQDTWNLKASWLEMWKNTRKLEFKFQLALAEMTHGLVEHGVDPLEARSAMLEQMKVVLDEIGRHARTTAVTLAVMEQRLNAQLIELAARSQPDAAGASLR